MPPAAGTGTVVPAWRPVTGRVVTGAAVTGTPNVPATAIRLTSSAGPTTTAPWSPAAAAVFGSPGGPSSLTTVFFPSRSRYIAWSVIGHHVIRPSGASCASYTWISA